MQSAKPTTKVKGIGLNPIKALEQNYMTNIDLGDGNSVGVSHAELLNKQLKEKIQLNEKELEETLSVQTKTVNADVRNKLRQTAKLVQLYED